MKRFTIFVSILTLMICTGIKFHSPTSNAFAKSTADVAPGPAMPPQPPESNPHPPVSAEDVKRVQFAEDAVKILLMNNLNPSLKTLPLEENKTFENKTLACLKQVSCYSKDLHFTNELVNLLNQNGKILEIKHAHIIPWSFVNFKKGPVHSEIQTRPSNEKSAKMAMSTPPSMPQPLTKTDEYMIHVYAKFSKNQTWYHLDVIVTEDKQGNIFLRHFYAVPMPTNSQNFPPGVVC